MSIHWLATTVTARPWRFATLLHRAGIGIDVDVQHRHPSMRLAPPGLAGSIMRVSGEQAAGAALPPARWRIGPASH
jgi:hypothetical protein